MAEAPTRKTTDGTKPTRKRSTATKAIDLAVWDVVRYNGEVDAVVTAINKVKAQVYLDSPVCKWVDIKDCKRG